MTQTSPIRILLENLARCRAFLAGPPPTARTTGDETEDAAGEQRARRRYEEYLHWGFSPYSAW